MQQLKKILLTTSLMGACTAGAQTDSLPGIGDQALQPVEVRAVRAGSNSPFAKTEVNAKDIEKLNQGQDIPYLLQYTPSTVATSDAGAGIGYTALRVRGTDGTRMNVTLNGIPVNDAESQGAFFVNFGDIASSLSSVQLQRGVGASTNGAAAFGATMSLSNMRQMTEPGVELLNTYGSFNTWKHTLRAGTGLMKNGLQFDLRLSKISSDGYVERSASDLKSLQLIAGWQASAKTSFRFLLMTGKEKTGQAWNGVPQDSLATNRTYNELGMKSDGTFYDNQTDNYQQDYYQFFADHKFSDYLTGHVGLFLTRGRGYYEEYKLGESFSDYGLPDFINNTDTATSADLIRQLWLDNHYYGSVFSLMYEKNKTQVTFGGAFTQYKGQHYGFVKWAEYGIPADHRWYLLDAQKNDFNAYMKAQQTFGDKLIVYGDLQYRTVGYFMNGFRKNPALRPAVTYNFINPKAGVTYLLKNTGSNHQKVYASAAVANKEPNRDDFEAGTVSAPKPERLYDLEAGYEINRLKWSLGANYYYMMYQDQLVFTGKVNDVGAYTRTNVPESYRTGIELQAGVMPATWLRINANATFSQNKISNFTEYIDNYDDNTQQAVNYSSTDLAFSPSAIAGGVITFIPVKRNNQNLELDLMGKYVGKQYLDNSMSDKKAIDAYGLADLRLRYTVKFKPFKELGLALAANNLLDKKYVSNGYTFSYIYGGATTTQNYYYPQAGLNWLVSISMKW